MTITLFRRRGLAAPSIRARGTADNSTHGRRLEFPVKKIHGGARSSFCGLRCVDGNVELLVLAVLLFFFLFLFFFFALCSSECAPTFFFSKNIFSVFLYPRQPRNRMRPVLYC